MDLKRRKLSKYVAWGVGGWASDDGNRQKRRLGCRPMDLKRRKRAKTSLGVPADGPQTPETGENVVWGAGRWTSNDGNGRKRCLGCYRMDLKRRKRVKWRIVRTEEGKLVGR